MAHQRIKVEAIRAYSDWQLNWPALIPPLRRDGYIIDDKMELSIHGEAPKSFLNIREYGLKRPTHKQARWIGYIAKVGSKCYPLESITEHLLTRVGQAFGVDVANSQIRMVGRQVRFLSKFFRTKNEQLVHGIEIFADHLDKEMVEEIAAEKAERDFYTFSTVCAAVQERFPDEFMPIMCGFVEMLAFDAIIGHMDRHPANWGVIVPVKAGRDIPRFSPVFDTARALLWNVSEQQVRKMLCQPKMLEAYINRATPLIGWDQVSDLDHFVLVSTIHQDYEAFRPCLDKFCSPDLLANCLRIIHDEFRELLSSERLGLISRILEYRHEQYRDAIGCCTNAP